MSQQEFLFPSNGKDFLNTLVPEDGEQAKDVFLFPSNGKDFLNTERLTLFPASEELIVSIPFKREGLSEPKCPEETPI